MIRHFLLSTLILGSSLVSAHAMTATIRWCSGSPEFKISGAPKETAKLRLFMNDLDAPSYDHGGGVVPYTPVVKCGALSSSPYSGPSPPAGETHTYRWTIEAQDVAGKSLAKINVDKRFPEK